MSNRELSALAGASHAVVYQIEAGLIQALKASLAIRLARACGATVQWLVEGEGEAPTKAQVQSAIEAARSEASAPVDDTGTFHRCDCERSKSGTEG